MAIQPETARHPEKPGDRALAMLSYLDVVLVALSVVPALVVGAPPFGYGLGAGGWIAQRVINMINKRWIGRLGTPVKQVSAGLFEAFGRIFLLAGVIVLAGVAGGRPDGLAAALVIFGAYTVAFVIKVIMGPPGKRTGQ